MAAATERREQQAAEPRPQPHPSFPEPLRRHPVVITWAERTECTCPEPCERDHEQD